MCWLHFLLCLWGDSLSQKAWAVVRLRGAPASAIRNRPSRERMTQASGSLGATARTNCSHAHAPWSTATTGARPASTRTSSTAGTSRPNASSTITSNLRAIRRSPSCMCRSGAAATGCAGSLERHSERSPMTGCSKQPKTRVAQFFEVRYSEVCVLREEIRFNSICGERCSLGILAG